MATRRTKGWTMVGMMAAVCLILTGCAAKPAAQSIERTAQSNTARHADSTKTISHGSSTDTHSQTSVPKSFTNSVHTIASNIRMFDANDGISWGYRGGAFHLYETNNGGLTWAEKRVPDLPTDQVSANGPGGPDFVYPVILNSKIWWFTWIDGGKAHVLSTNDSGDSWSISSFAVPDDVRQIGGAQFVSPKDGWILCFGGGNADAVSKYLFHTQTSGKSWTLVNDSTRGLPHNGTSTMMDFGANGKMGVIATVDPTTQSIVVDETYDSGLHWHLTTLDAPTTGSEIPTLLMARAISPHEFLIESSLPTASGNRLLIQSQFDGGKWISNSVVVGQVQAVASITPDSLVVLERNNRREWIMRTIDGGITWYTAATPLPSTIVGEHLISFDIADPATWFILAEDDRLTPSLFKSPDAGNHWSQL